tara:strand:- start:1982 stop:2527 length:546 start_codon:yes stop_codon:yes gene_type:complete
MRFYSVPGFWIDAAQCLLVFIHWLACGLIVDLNNFDSAHKGVSLYLAILTVSVNFYRLSRSLSILGTQSAQDYPETVLGLWFEIVSQAQGWGLAFCAAREWSLDANDDFFKDPFLHKLANSVFEMSLVQAGVGWAAAAPYTLAERAVAWCAAYIGGVLTVNLFLLSIVLGRRGWWNSIPAR